MIKHKRVFWAAAFIIGWGFDFFYWEKPPGISFTLHILLALGALLYVAHREGTVPARRSLWLLAPLGVFSILTFIRQEPFTRVLNHLVSLGTGALLLLTFRGGRWAVFSLADYVVGALKLLLHILILPIQLLSEKDTEEISEDQPSTWKFLLPYLRGVLLALPVLVLFAALFSAADPIFADRLQGVIATLHLEDLPEYIARLFLISIWSFLVAGLLLYALQKSGEDSPRGADPSWPPRFLGFTESAIILGGVNLLFFSFVLIQFRYFFGGEENISSQGYTYAAYARRGFGELLTVAFFSLLLFITLSAITRRESRKTRVGFSTLTSTLTLFVGIILASSFQRLRLYESAYGFTRLRTYAHLCLLWIGILFAAILALEILLRWRYFTLASLLSVLGFLLTMNLINVDGFITRQNFERAAAGKALDVTYVNGLSNDAVPHLVHFADSPWLDPSQQRQLQASLACREVQLAFQSQPWQGFLWSRFRAKRLLERHQSTWEGFEPFQDDDTWYVLVDGKRQRCRPQPVK